METLLCFSNALCVLSSTIKNLIRTRAGKSVKMCDLGKLTFYWPMVLYWMFPAVLNSFECRLTQPLWTNSNINVLLGWVLSVNTVKLNATCDQLRSVNTRYMLSLPPLPYLQLSFLLLNHLFLSTPHPSWRLRISQLGETMTLPPPTLCFFGRQGTKGSLSNIVLHNRIILP